MPPPRPVPVEAPRELAVASRLHTVRIGLALTLIVVLGSGAYLAATWDGPHRTLITAVLGVALVSVAVLKVIPTERIIRGRWREHFFLIWSALDVALVAT